MVFWANPPPSPPVIAATPSAGSHPFYRRRHPLTPGPLESIASRRASAPATPRELPARPGRTPSPPASSSSCCCCWCARLCWPRMMWRCHVSPSECRCYRLKGFSLLKRFPLSAGAAGRLLEQPVGDWLEHVGLPQYESKLLLNGFDDLHYMVSDPPLYPVVSIPQLSLTAPFIVFFSSSKSVCLSS